jgi:hypothetical protein
LLVDQEGWLLILVAVSYCLYFESMTVGLAWSGYFRSKALFLSCADVCGFLLHSPQTKVVRRML